jgi:ring-1,2-phenylacetyl-CoA epoxidase subunit PaaC
LEEDLALANNALDLMGQARLLYQHVAALRQDGSDEDRLAYFRDAHEFKNHTLLELPHSTALAPTTRGDRDYAVTIVRNFLYSSFMVLVWDALQHASDAQLAAIASKSRKEALYHVQHAQDWLIRFGDGTAESHARAQAALNHLMPYTQSFWLLGPVEADALKGLGVAHFSGLKTTWQMKVDNVVLEAALAMPTAQGHVPEGHLGRHSEHLGLMLAEMQSLARAHPDGSW